MKIDPEKYGFKEWWPPSAIRGSDFRIIGSVWHYFHPVKKIFLDYNWMTRRFRAFKA